MAADTLERARTRFAVRSSVKGWILPVLAVAVLALAVGWGIGHYLDARMPGNNSAEAGFARDMAVHHTQAVEMSLIVRDRTNDDKIGTLATDILLTQQNQIGYMEGWLAVWDVSLTGNEPAMAWMGHEVQGQMPGMASQAEVDQLRTMPVDEMNAEFLRLMIIHHVAGVDMADAILERSDRPEVVRLAEAIARTQQAEIDLMNDILTRLGAPTVDPAAATPTVDHDHED
ncbi:MAG: DUF305 domain-containing protein [Thermomicrobiales bacterium]